jgi:hypothetical protein
MLIFIVLFQVTTSNAYGASTSAGAISTDNSPNVITDGMAQTTVELSAATTVTGQVLSDDAQSVASVSAGSIRLVGSTVQGGANLAARGVIGGTSLVVRGTVGSVMFVGRGIGSGFMAAGHLVGGTFDFVAGVTHVKALIRPADSNAPTTTIKQLRIQQAALIQSGTESVSITPVADGVGGACDNGEGNGGYPLRWCAVPMDTVATVSYSNDPINRECTSYAYWYFTSIEGHSSLHVEGNAKYWAATSNFPTYSVPVVGAIAVETAGAYGHVAIVQALPGQKYGGLVVPAGYILVSEMNYDWNGHFRYSYSPLNKFSAYIYP